MRVVRDINCRCSVCDFIENGQCHNYEIDRYTLEGTLNHVGWRPNQGNYICIKCWDAVTDIQYREEFDQRLLEWHDGDDPKALKEVA